ncbi:UNVERIFIED_CONTAM: EH domain-containing protein 1 [Sesamum latifolium]|uniref:EH domain-containing protein 1 n=1 Tax=Sesamum latifolium TaxID=2727402 RepID=A0AAW2WTU0_9LAMI
MEIDSAPISRCSKDHQKIYQDWFSFADSDGDGRLTEAMLSSSLACPTCLVKISNWQGFLGFKEFITAMQLVSLAQAGHALNSDILTSEVDFENLQPPAMEGLDVLLAKKKRVSSEPEQNGSVQPQSSPAASWFSSSKSAKKVSLSSVTSIIDGLKKLYVQKLKPLEVTYRFNDFVSPLLTNSDFDAKPMVMLLGAHIGPEPTTDRFVVVMNGPDERSIPGNTVAVQADMPFSGLTTFGTAFLSKFECSQMPHPLLEHITFVDTPGVLSGEKQRTQRSYDFTGVTSWFAAKCDLILLLFDPHKLDISDEFKRVIGSLRGHDDKIRVVLNKADQVDTQQLMRVYGALMWSLGKVLNTPEVMRVYIGSFNDKPINEAASGPIGKELFEKEQDDLLTDLKDIPKKACDRRAAKIHSYIISHLKKEMPAMMGKAKTQQRLIDNLPDEFAKVQREHHLPVGDFPNVEHFREVLSGYSIDKFEKLKPKMIQSVDDMLGYDIPELLKNFRNPYD